MNLDAAAPMVALPFVKRVGATTLRLAMALAPICTMSDAIVAVAAAGVAQVREERRLVTISEQPLGDALIDVSAQFGISIAFVGAQMESLKAPSVAGHYSIREILELVLVNSGFHSEFIDERTVRVVKSELTSRDQRRATGELAGSPLETLEEITVTAQKRAENLRNVPIAISAFSEAALNAKGIDSPLDLQFAVPNLNIAQSEGGNAVGIARIRGVGVSNFGVFGEPGVPIHLDGHYYEPSFALFRDFLDVERVEVLRGPQGTLYGRNAIAGNINIISNRPTDSVEGNVSLDAGNYDKLRVQGVVSGPLSDSVRARVAASRETRDGYFENVAPDRKEDSLVTSDYVSARVSMEIDVTDDLQVFLSGNYYDDEGINGFLYMRGIEQPERPYEVMLNEPHEESDKVQGASADVSWQLGTALFRSLTAYTESSTARLADGNGMLPGSLGYDNEYDYDTFSQELQLQSTDSGRLKWVGGLYYFERHAFRQVQQNARLTDINKSDITSYSAYGQGEYLIAPKLTAIAGIRYTHDQQEFLEYIGGNRPSSKTGAKSWDAITYRLGLNYDVSADAMLYAALATGFKAGGYTVEFYDPEYVDTVEIGLKSAWLDNRLMINLAGYYYDYQDMQVYLRSDTGVGLSRFTNAGSATIAGVEVEIQAIVAKGLSIDASLAYQSAEFDEFLTVDNLYPNRGPQDLSGNRLAGTPEWQASLGPQYKWAAGKAGWVTLRADVAWVGDRESTEYARPHELAPSYSRINARVQWENDESNWRAELYGQNLKNEATLGSFSRRTGAQDLFLASYLAPRTYGLKVSHSF